MLCDAADLGKFGGVLVVLLMHLLPCQPCIGDTSAGGLRWRQAANQQAANNPSSNSSSSIPRQQGEQDPQQVDPAVLQQQVERDVQRLAQDVFKAGQVLAGGRCANCGLFLTALNMPATVAVSVLDTYVSLCSCSTLLQKYTAAAVWAAHHAVQNTYSLGR